MARNITEVRDDLLNIFNSFSPKDPNGIPLDTSEGSLPYDFLSAVALYVAGNSDGSITGLENEIETNGDEAFLHLAKTEKGIINGAIEVGIYRKEGIKSSGYVTFYGIENTVIASNKKIAAGNLVFLTQETKIIPASGNVEVLVQAENIGSEYNVVIGAINTLVDNFNNVNNIINLEKFTNGTDIEDLESLRTRALKIKRNPPHHGTRTYYELLAKNELKQIYGDIEGVDGVGGCRVLPRTPTVGSVTVYITNLISEIPSNQLVTDVQAVMDKYKIETANIIVLPAISKSINISVNLILADGIDRTNVEPILKISIRDYLRTVFDKGKIRVDNTGIDSDDYKYAVSWSEIGNIIFEEEGIVGYDNLIINGQSETLILEDFETPILGTLTLT